MSTEEMYDLFSSLRCWKCSNTLLDDDGVVRFGTVATGFQKGSKPSKSLVCATCCDKKGFTELRPSC